MIVRVSLLLLAPCASLAAAQAAPPLPAAAPPPAAAVPVAPTPQYVSALPPAAAAPAAVLQAPAAPAALAAQAPPLAAPPAAPPAPVAAPPQPAGPPPALAAPAAVAVVASPPAAPAAPVAAAGAPLPPPATPSVLAAAGDAQSTQTSWMATNYPQTYRLWQFVTAAAIVKALCMAGNVMVQVSPYPQVKRWASRGCTGEADAAPYVSIAFGGWQWCFYGTFAWLLTGRSGFLILVHSNSLGALLGTYYTITFHRNCRSEHTLNTLRTYLSAVTALVLLQVCGMLALVPERALFLTGIVSSFCSFIGALSMLVTVPAVLASQDSRSIPGPLVFANFCSAMVWCICGWMLSDPLVMGPNVVSCLSSGFCLSLKYRFPSEAADGEDLEGMPLPIAHKGKLAEADREAATAGEMTPLVGKGQTTAEGKAYASSPASQMLGASFNRPEPEEEASLCADGTGGTW